MSRHSLRDIFARDRIPSIPSVVSQLQQPFRNFRFEVHRIVDLVRFDPGLVCEFIRQANQCSNSLREVSSLHSAVLACGPELTWRILRSVQSADWQPEFGRLRPMYEYGWSQCLTGALAAEALGEFEFREGTCTMFLTGLICDLGVLALMYAYPTEYHDQVWTPLMKDRNIEDLQDLERDTFGFSHVTVGHELGRRWRLGESFSSAILQHHQRINGGFHSMISQAATRVIEVLNARDSNDRMRAELDEHLRTCFQASPEQIDRYLEQIAVRRSEVGVQLGFRTTAVQNSHLAAQPTRL